MGSSESTCNKLFIPEVNKQLLCTCWNKQPLAVVSHTYMILMSYLISDITIHMLKQSTISSGIIHMYLFWCYIWYQPFSFFFYFFNPWWSKIIQNDTCSMYTYIIVKLKKSQLTSLQNILLNFQSYMHGLISLTYCWHVNNMMKFNKTDSKIAD